MVIDMNETQLKTVAQLRTFLNGTLAVEFQPMGEDSLRYEHIAPLRGQILFRAYTRGHSTSRIPQINRSKDLNLRIASWRSTMDRANHSRDIVLYAEPAGRGQDNSCNASRAKVLLMPEVLIGRDKYLNPVLFCGVKQFPVLELRPAAFVCG